MKADCTAKDTLYVFSTGKTKYFGKLPVAHVGERERGGINYMPLCGWRSSGMTGWQKMIPADKNPCERCRKKFIRLHGRDLPASF